MTEAELPSIRVHDDPVLFREALNFTSAETLFPSRLIEKDYYCTVLLAYLTSANKQLVFKGGTCLAKVHGNFYRLSEDLDFTIPMPVTTSRSQRAKQAVSLKNAVARLADKVPCFRIAEPLRGANVSTQYIATISYSSMITRQDEIIMIEVSLREPLFMPAMHAPARTMLLDPITGRPIISPVTIPCIARMEAYAEKYRAALTRRDVAIRDFYDLDYAIKKLGVQPRDTSLVELIKSKLDVPGNDPINVGQDRIMQLRGQLEARLKPVLREADYDAFDLERAFAGVAEMANHLSG